MSSPYFNQEKKWKIEHLEEVKKHIPISQYLNGFDWFFVPPLYMQGYEINILKDLMNKGNTDPKEISRVIIRKFHDIGFSASFIRGYCSRVTFIEPFTSTIEHSMILAYQKDYEGAIKTLLPIIEGILRQYLIQEKGKTNESINFGDIKGNSLKKGCLELLKEANYKSHLENYISPVTNQPSTFQPNEIDELVALEKEYYDIWFSFFTEFILKSLYLDSSHNNIDGLLNRHSVSHEFNDKTLKYTIENYIKLYISINFLMWAFLIFESKSLLSECSDEDYLKTFLAYRKIVEGSKFLLEAKATLDERYKPHVKPHMSFKEKLVDLFIHNWAVKRK